VLFKNQQHELSIKNAPIATSSQRLDRSTLKPGVHKEFHRDAAHLAEVGQLLPRQCRDDTAQAATCWAIYDGPANARMGLKFWRPTKYQGGPKQRRKKQQVQERKKGPTCEAYLCELSCV
jgi:hypothetical protein